MKHQFSLSISSLCSQKWADMSSSAEGKFCLHCQKTIIDFRQMTDNEIATFMYAHKGKKICGAISHTQKDKKYLFIQPQKIGSPVKRYVMAVLAGLVTAFPLQIKAINSLPNVSITQYTSIEKSAFIQKEDASKSISGQLINKKNGQAISNVWVRINIEKAAQMYLESEFQNLKEHSAESQAYKEIKAKKLWFHNKLNEWDLTQFQSKTDNKGNFSFVLPNDFPECEVELMFTLVYNQPKDSKGQVIEGQVNTIKDYLFYYKGGKQLLEIKTLVIMELAPIIEEPYMIGEMPYYEE